jgi:radical SAM protein with 4Fe4S-binding SPASM domain
VVVDSEMFDLLRKLDGSRTLDELTAQRPRSERRAIARAIDELVGQGAVEGAGRTASGRDDAPRIENVAVNVTRRCNLRCRFCYYLGSLASSPKGELSASETAGVLREARPFLSRTPTLALLGGEPFLEEAKLFEIARAAAGSGFKALVSTNGTLVTRDSAREARRAGLEVQVSLDGHEAGPHDAVRGRGAFEKAVRGVRALVEEGAHTILSMVCHRGSLPHLEAFYDLALELGADEARFIPLKRMGGALGKAQKPVSMRRLLLAAFEMFARRPELLKLAGRDCFSITASACRLSARRGSCGTGRQTFLLDADGAIYPCLNTCAAEFRVANVREPGFDFARTWRESPVLERVRRASDVEAMNERCAACVVRQWCLGGCRGETHATRGSLSAPAWNCRDLKRAMIEMMWMISERPDFVRGGPKVC